MVAFAPPRADRLYVLAHARIVREGDPLRFAAEPSTAFV